MRNTANLRIVPPPEEETGTRILRIPVVGGVVTLEVPDEISDPTLYKEIATQDISRKRLTSFIDRFAKISGSNRELLLCSEPKLKTITREFLLTCEELRRFVTDLSTFHSSLPELEEAREDIKAFFYGHISGAIDEIADFQEIVFSKAPGEVSFRRKELDTFRKILAKSTGLVRTELQKIFAHLFARDPRNLFRVYGVRSQQEILFRQFRHDVEITDLLYSSVRKLDTYMRGAIIPSDLIRMIAGKIEREGSVSCLFDPDYMTFLSDLIDEVLEILLPEIQEVLYLDGIWFDDFENIEQKAKMLSDVCLSFKVFYQERRGLREEIRAKVAAAGVGLDFRDDSLETILKIFDTYRYRDVAESVRSIDQILVDLESTLLQWEKGIARRAFARDEWRAAEPLQRRAGV